MSEIVFLVEEALEGGFTARALGYSIYTEGDTWDELKSAIQDALACHFEESVILGAVKWGLGRLGAVSACFCGFWL